MTSMLARPAPDRRFAAARPVRRRRPVTRPPPSSCHDRAPRRPDAADALRAIRRRRAKLVARRPPRSRFGSLARADAASASSSTAMASRCARRSGVGLREIDAAVREKGRWIVARLAEQRERARQRRRGAHRLARRRDDRLPRPAADDRPRSARRLGAGAAALLDGECRRRTRARLLVGLPRDAGEERIRDAVQSWLQREARRVFAARAAHFAERLGVRVTRLALSSATTRWGSANANGSVRLHWRLIQHPLATIDYVVAHELAHLREMNHSAALLEGRRGRSCRSSGTQSERSEAAPRRRRAEA